VVNSDRVVCNKVILLVDKLLPLPQQAVASTSILASSMPANIHTMPPRRLTCNYQTYADLLETPGTRPGLEIADQLNNGREASSETSGSASNDSAASVNGSPSNSTSAEDGQGDVSSGSRNVAAIAGGVVGGIVVLAVLGILVWKFIARRRSKPAAPLRKSSGSSRNSQGSSPKLKYSAQSAPGSPRSGNFESQGDSADESLQIVVHQMPLDSFLMNTARVDLNSNPGDAGLESLGTKLEDAPSLLPLQLVAGEVKVDVDCNGKQILLGTGSFGSVFRGTLRGVQPIAGKVLTHPGNAAEKDFIREAEILQHVSRNKNIVQLYGITTVQDKLVLVMELMEGGDLRNAIDNDPDRLLHWSCHGKDVALDIARGITALHACNVIHRDLKSKNVLLSSFGGSGVPTAKLGDVGVSAWLPTNGFLSAGNGVVGTLAWVAPEVLLGQRCDCKVDVYSFRIILFELATGKMPTRGFDNVPEVSERCSQELVDLILQCTKQDPTLRPTAKEAYDRILQI
jgi:hypothetical protein